MNLIWILSRLRIRRNHKDTLFCDLFSDKSNALSLYNAINGTSYDKPDELMVVTIQDVIYMHQKNDVSVLFDSKLTLWEQQSTLNPNMPLRGLMYYARNMEGILSADDRKRMFGRQIVKIPTPEYYVLYNGTESAPERQELRLSDAFEVPTDGYEWTAHFININAGHNKDIMDGCPTLMGYAYLMGEIGSNLKRGMKKRDAVDHAMRSTISSGYLVEYLGKIYAEARAMLLTEFDEKLWEKGVREEERSIGREEGRKEARIEDIIIFVDDQLEENISPEKIKSKLVNKFGHTGEEAETLVKRMLSKRGG